MDVTDSFRGWHLLKDSKIYEWSFGWMIEEKGLPAVLQAEPEMGQLAIV